MNIIRIVYIYIDRYICMYVCMKIDKHTSIYCNGSVKTRRCVCVWVYMRFVLRTQAWQCINDKILEGTKYTLRLSLSLERNKNLYRTFDDCVVYVHRAEFLLFFFLSFPLFLSVRFCCLYGNNKRWREEEVLYSVYYLVGWFFFRVIILSPFFSPHFIVTRLLFFLLLPTRFVDNRPRKGRGHPIERKEKKRVISSCQWGCFFFVLHQRVTHTIHSSFTIAAFLSLSLSLFYLFLFVNLHLDTHTQSKTSLYWMYC